MQRSGLLGAFVMLVVGFAVYVLTDRIVYRPLRRRVTSAARRWAARASSLTW